MYRNLYNSLYIILRQVILMGDNMIASNQNPLPTDSERIEVLEDTVSKIKDGAGVDEEIKDEIVTMKENQRDIQGKLSNLESEVAELRGEMAGTREAVDSIQDSQQRMFQLIKEQAERLKDGDKFFEAVKKYMSIKDTQNGYRDKEVKELKETVDKKTSKEDFESEKKTTHEWVKQISKNQDKQDEKVFRLMLALVVGILAIAGSLLLAYLNII